MVSSIDYRPLADEQELHRFKALDAQCFVGTTQDADTYFDQVGSENFRVLFRDGQMLGGLGILQMGQWWGGACVPMAGIVSVGIAPEHRGNGSAIALMRSAVHELYEANYAISVLYPATQRLYRKAGYQQGGTHCSWEIQTERIHVKGRSLPITPMTPNPDALQAIYAQYAAQQNGWVDRHHSIWLQKIRPKSDETVYGYRVGSESQPEGYLVYTQQRAGGQGILTIRDWTALSADAAKTLWGFLFSHRSQIDRIRWQSGTLDPMLAVLPEQSAQRVDAEFWMLRIVNVPLALEHRGYPSHANGELHLTVQDTEIAANTDSFVLTLDNGRSTVHRGGRGDLVMGSRGLASLYTGLYSPQQLRWMGWLEGSDAGVAIATQFFAGSHPSMPDFF